MLTLEEVKRHCRIDHDDEDALIQTLIDGAVHSVCDYLNVTTLPAYPAVEIAVLMLVGALYENRESVTDRPLSDNRLYDRLLAPYRAMEA